MLCCRVQPGRSKEKRVRAILPCHFLGRPTAPLKQPGNLLLSYPTPPGRLAPSCAGHGSKCCGKAKLPQATHNCLGKTEGNHNPMAVTQALHLQQAASDTSPGLITIPASRYQLREGQHSAGAGDTRACRWGWTQSRRGVCHSSGDMNQFPGIYSNANNRPNKFLSASTQGRYDHLASKPSPQALAMQMQGFNK